MRFNLDNPVFDYLNTAVHYCALNIVFILCCLPIVTAGPAIAALYQVMMREARGEHGYLLSKFFLHFKEMFVQAALTFFLFVLLIGTAGYAAVFWFGLGTMIGLAAAALAAVFCLLCLAAAMYAFPLMARFQNSFRQTLKNAFLMVFVHFKATAGMILICVFMISMYCLFTPMKIFMLLIGFSFIFFCCSFILNKVFEPYVKAAPAA
ncbi:MAG: YesL family protein [Eubacteriaceae bacterium]